MPNDLPPQSHGNDKVLALFTEALELLHRRRIRTTREAFGALRDRVSAIACTVGTAPLCGVSDARHDLRALIDLAVTARNARDGDVLDAVDVDTAASYLDASRPRRRREATMRELVDEHGCRWTCRKIADLATREADSSPRHVVLCVPDDGSAPLHLRFVGDWEGWPPDVLLSALRDARDRREANTQR